MPDWHLQGALHEDGINRLFAQIEAQRPSMFNSATAEFMLRPELLCWPVPKPPNGAPTIKTASPMRLVDDERGRVLLNYFLQLREPSIGFYPGDPGVRQRFAMSLKGCLGIGVPATLPDSAVRMPSIGDLPPPPPIDVLLPIDRVQSHELLLRVVGRAVWTTEPRGSHLVLVGESVTIDGLLPRSMHDLVASYVLLLLNASVLPAASFAVEKFDLEVQEKTISFALVPSAKTPNPDVDRDRLSFFLTLR
jgi:hypothetical protein